MAFFYFFGDDYDLCQLSDLLFLDDLLDADFAVAEHGGYGCQDTRLVFYQHTQEVFRTDVIHRFDLQLFVAGATDPAAALILEVSGNIKDISDHRTCRWQFSGSAAVEHGIIHGITMYKNGVERIIDGCQWMSFRDQHRMDAYFDSFRCVACHAEKFDHAAGFFCIADIGCR